MHHTLVPNQIFEHYFQKLRNSERTVYLCLLHHSMERQSDRIVQVPQVRLEKFCGLSHETFSKAKRRLIALGLIGVESPYKKNHPTIYWVLSGEKMNSEYSAQPDTTAAATLTTAQLSAKAVNLVYPIWFELLQNKFNQKIGKQITLSPGTYIEFFLDKVWRPFAGNIDSSALQLIIDAAENFKMIPPEVIDGPMPF